MKKWFFVPLTVFVLVFALGCAANYNQVMKDSEKTFYSGKYKEAARSLLPAVNKSGKNQLLFMMEAGLMLHAAHDYENSNKVLLEAAKLSERIATSISKQAGSLLLNETVTNYKGEDFERVLIHMYLGINFLMLKNADSARVEFKKVNDILRDINVTTGKQYKQNLMAKYLTAIAFEISADKDNDFNDREFAYVEYKQIYQLDPRLALVYRDLQRLSKKLDDAEDYNKWVGQFGKRDYIPQDAGELVMIYQAGQGAVKVSRGSLLSDQAMAQGIRVTLNGMTLQQGVTIGAVLAILKLAQNPIPRFKQRSNKVDYLLINVNGKDVDRTYMLEDIETTAVKNLEDDYKRLYMKVAAGIAVKAAASVAAGIAAKKAAEQFKKVGGYAGLIGTVVGGGVGVGLASQIKPDLRCWHTLPGNLQLGRIFLAPGTYNIQIKFFNNQGQQVINPVKSTVEIKKGEKTIYNYRTLF
ncbi:MAG TPA: hypothetical protein ENN21_04700 [Spirochaetes bacterium]|nr:hypothetical protein [Spirochaetota bacterium]